jgi:acetyl esterase/lipase
MIQPQAYSYDEFPPASDSPQGMQVLETNREEWYSVYEKDVPYIERDGMQLHLQIIRPAHADRERKDCFPCVVYVQGSAWMKQDVYFNLGNLARLAQRGFVVAVVEYRPSDVAIFPAQVQDAKTAVRFLRLNAARFMLDAQNIFVFGDSSGGHTALMVGITDGLSALDTPEYAQVSAQVNAVVDFYGPTDITRMNDVPSVMDHIVPESPEGRLIGVKNVLEHAAEAQKTNPARYLSAERPTPPILMLHGDKDPLVPFNQSVLLYEALRAAGKEVTFYKLQGAVHGGPQFWNDRVLGIVETFLRSHLH